MVIKIVSMDLRIMSNRHLSLKKNALNSRPGEDLKSLVPRKYRSKTVLMQNQSYEGCMDFNPHILPVGISSLVFQLLVNELQPSTNPSQLSQKNPQAIDLAGSAFFLCGANCPGR